jgi:hypothetical protein
MSTTGGIEGRAFRSDTNEPFGGAQIELWDPESETEGRLYTRTDEQGNYAYTDVPPGAYLVAITVNLVNEDDSPCQEFDNEVVGMKTRTYRIRGMGHMAVLQPGGRMLTVQTAMKTTVSAGQVVQRDIDLYCHDE